MPSCIGIDSLTMACDSHRAWPTACGDHRGWEPHIVHFSGHGSTNGELILTDSLGQASSVSEQALSGLFGALKDNIRCVVLNACFSEHQASAIAEHIDCVIGMSSTVGDAAAIAFSSSFYQALAYGKDIKSAYELGLVQINLEGLPDAQTPILLAPNSDPRQIVFARD